MIINKIFTLTIEEDDMSTLVSILFKNGHTISRNTTYCNYPVPGKNYPQTQINIHYEVYEEDKE